MGQIWKLKKLRNKWQGTIILPNLEKKEEITEVINALDRIPYHFASKP